MFLQSCNRYQGCNHRGDRCDHKFSDTLTLSQPRGADSAHHCRGYVPVMYFNQANIESKHSYCIMDYYSLVKYLYEVAFQ